MNLSFRHYCFISFFFLLIIPSLLFAQNNKTLKYGVSTTAYSATSGSDLPFWLYANTDGKVDKESSNFITQLYSHYQLTSEDEDFRLATGFDLSSRFSQDNAVLFNELYGSVGYKNLNLKVGRFYDTIGLNDSNLSMGSMQVSRNATPIPKIELSTDGFIDIPLTNGLMEFKAMISHGWLEEDRYVKSPYLHQKYFYFKFNFNRIEIIGGGIHNVVWGGKDPNRGQLPSSFSDFINVFTGSAASPDSNVPLGEIQNAIGNTVGAYDTGIRLNLDRLSIKAYRSFFLEDRVAAQFRSPWDGVWGLNIDLEDKEGIVTEFMWEHMNTKRQDAFDSEPRGESYYYNHFVYQSGWSYNNRVLGNPLILYGNNPNFVGTDAISNNIIVAHHIGLQGKPLDRFNYKAYFTYSRNYGTKKDQEQGQGPLIPIEELRVDEYSVLLKGNYDLLPENGIQLTASTAFDIGELYQQNRFGFQLGVRWNNIISN